jgi:hypothetical protein
MRRWLGIARSTSWLSMRRSVSTFSAELNASQGSLLVAAFARLAGLAVDRRLCSIDIEAIRHTTATRANYGSPPRVIRSLINNWARPSPLL